ncbi:MAG: hypothetical protein E6970_00170 [Peptostreptococcus sp.]|uniref:hypothetical protein n=1 Tax=Peptostreptococcus TaxID=1257 RepID=UPI00076783CA|nr:MULTISPECIES: hypothetical protein [Peptostreptococcus]KXB72773.1 hypothetical protein HMPREF3183_00615 [Peptostreptococcus anaerobius]MDU1264217.1 hypothetical protein [Peptostreptococcus sp.]
MKRLNTPLGDISIKINDKEISYEYKKCANDRTCPNLLGRYLIEIISKPTGEEYSISCEIINNKSLKSEIENGEMLECIGFYGEGRIKLSIGAYGESWGYIGSRLMETSNDYDIEYKPNGLSYLVLKETETEKYYFAVSWIDDVGYEDPINNGEHDRDVETWYGSDPILLI